MREIKFRALVQYAGKNPVWVYYGTLEIPHAFSAEDCKVLVKDQEFIGLKDKKGKEIYEGDILNDGRLLGEVYFDDGSGGFHTKQAMEGDYLGDWVSRCEIIGNIHENPELLEGK